MKIRLRYSRIWYLIIKGLYFAFLRGKIIMEQYRFPLQRLLDIRIDKEDMSKRDFVEAQRQKGMAEDKLNILKGDYKKHNVNKDNESIVARKLKNQYLNSLNNGINDAKDYLIEKIEVVEINRENLKYRQIERKTVEILKEKRIDDFNKSQERIEQKTNDEFALYAHIRKLERR